MSLAVCLADLRAKGAISEARYEALLPRYEELVRQYEGRYGREAAEAMATEKTLKLWEGDALHRKRYTLLQAKKQGEWLAEMRKRAGDGPFDRRHAEQKLVDMDYHRQAIRQTALQMNAELLRRMRHNLIGEVRDKAELRDVEDELFAPGSTGNIAAREMAQSWKETGEWLHSRFNAAGGRIAKLDTWHLPQNHDMRQVRDAGFEAWRDFLLGVGRKMRGLLDRTRMIDRDTGEPFTDAKLETVLLDIWTAISTDGWSRNNPGSIHAGAIANRRADARILHFVDADAWRAYNARFGGGATAFEAMTGHIAGMARDIAAMEYMGPNPAATLRWQQDWLRKSAEMAMQTGRAGVKATDAANMGVGKMQRLYDEYSGRNASPENSRMALGFSIFRNVQVAAKLGGATLSIGGDWGTMMKTAGFNGIPAHKVMARYAAMLNPRATADRAQAARHVLMADQWADGHAAQWRTTGEEFSGEVSRRMASGVLRASGLVAHTDIAKQAFGMEMVAHLTHMRERAFGNLDPALRGALERYGIGETQWDRIRHLQPETWKDTDWIYPETVAAAGEQDIADNLMRMIVTEADFAVPTPDLRTRAVLGGARFQRGNLMGEIMRSTFLFKGFPLTILNMHGRRMLEQGMSARGGWAVAQMLIWRYGLTLLGLTTVGGALSLQAKEVAKGRDPLPMNTLKFLGAALVQGGGMGIIGDLLYAAEDRFGGGIERTLIGPAGQALDSGPLAVVSNLKAMADGDPETETRWKKDLARLVLSETPGLSLWYARLPIERMLGDLITEWAYGEDIDAHYRRLDRAAEDRGTGYFAPPGLGLGGLRAPDWGNAWPDEDAAATMDAPE